MLGWVGCKVSLKHELEKHGEDESDCECGYRNSEEFEHLAASFGRFFGIERKLFGEDETYHHACAIGKNDTEAEADFEYFAIDDSANYIDRETYGGNGQIDGQLFDLGFAEGEGCH